MKIFLRVLLVIAIIILAIETTFIVLVIIDRYMHPCNPFPDNSSRQYDALAVQAHNSMFDRYMDKTNIKGKAIKELCAETGSYNQVADENFIVTIVYMNDNDGANENAIVLVDGNEFDDVQEKMSIIDANKKYKVTDEIVTETGIINKIIVTLVN